MKRLTLSVLALCAAFPAAADMRDAAQLAIIPGWQTADGTQMAGLQITLAPGWKTYWRAPGDGGIPPMIDFQGSQNIDTAQFHWPVPEVFYQNDMRSVGYTDNVVLPLEVTPDGTGPIRLTGSVQIGVCDEVCVPMTFAFDTLLPPSTTRHPALLAAFLDRPQTAAEAGVQSVTCDVTPNADGLELTATVQATQIDGITAMVIETGDTSVWVSEPTTKQRGNQISGTVDLISGTGGPIALDRSSVRITLLGPQRAVDVLGCAAR